MDARKHFEGMEGSEDRRETRSSRRDNFLNRSLNFLRAGVAFLALNAISEPAAAASECWTKAKAVPSYHDYELPLNQLGNVH